MIFDKYEGEWDATQVFCGVRNWKSVRNRASDMLANVLPLELFSYNLIVALIKSKTTFLAFNLFLDFLINKWAIKVLGIKSNPVAFTIEAL